MISITENLISAISKAHDYSVENLRDILKLFQSSIDGAKICWDSDVYADWVESSGSEIEAIYQILPKKRCWVSIELENIAIAYVRTDFPFIVADIKFKDLFENNATMRKFKYFFYSDKNKEEFNIDFHLIDKTYSEKLKKTDFFSVSQDKNSPVITPYELVFYSFKFDDNSGEKTDITEIFTSAEKVKSTWNYRKSFSIRDLIISSNVNLFEDITWDGESWIKIFRGDNELAAVVGVDVPLVISLKDINLDLEGMKFPIFRVDSFLIEKYYLNTNVVNKVFPNFSLSFCKKGNESDSYVFSILDMVDSTQ